MYWHSERNGRKSEKCCLGNLHDEDPLPRTFPHKKPEDSDDVVEEYLKALGYVSVEVFRL